MKNFVNPKKIKGQDKLERIKDLMGKMSTLNESTSLSEIENVKKGANGVTYAIIRENQNYFIKTTNKTSGTLIAEDFQYIGGLQNKNLERYNSYAESLKHLNLKFDMLNESYGIKENINLFESDAVEVKEANASGVVVKEEPELIEDEKSVIKVDVPATEAPVEDEVEDVEMSDDSFEGGDVEDLDIDIDEEGDEEGDDEDDGDGYTKKIQKYTGKIGQMLRDKDEPDPELDKYVINSIVSAIDWEEIPDEDVEDIIAKIEGEDEEDGELEGGDEDMDMEVEEGGEDEDPFGEEGGEDEDPFAGEELAESKIKKDLKKLKKDEVSESKTFSKKQLMENFLKKNINKSLNKIINEYEGNLMCEVCGEMHEGDCSTHIDESPEMSFDDNPEFLEIIKQNIKSAHDRGEKSPWDEEETAQVAREKGWAPLDEENNIDITNQESEWSGDDVNAAPQPFGENEMDVVDAIATGQNYLQASGDLDRDGDQIPNRLDMDNNMDGELDFETFNDGEDFVEIDFDSLMGNSPAPTKEPGIAPPTTDPGPKKPRWKKIGKPDALPKPKAMDRRKFSLGRKGMYR
jgi:rubrerythrin